MSQGVPVDREQFYYARDHDSDAGWCVRGPNNFYLAVPEKSLALAIAKFLSGNILDGYEIAKDFFRMCSALDCLPNRLQDKRK